MFDLVGFVVLKALLGYFGTWVCFAFCFFFLFLEVLSVAHLVAE